MRKLVRPQTPDWKGPVTGALVMLLSIVLVILGMEGVILVTRFVIG